MTITCPVCWRKVHASEPNGFVWRHHDKAGTPCPMGGHHIPLETIEWRAA